MAALHTRRGAPEHRAALTAQEVRHVPVQLVAIVGRVGTLRKAPLARSELLRGNRGPCTSASSRKPADNRGCMPSTSACKRSRLPRQTRNRATHPSAIRPLREKRLHPQEQESCRRS